MGLSEWSIVSEESDEESESRSLGSASGDSGGELCFSGVTEEALGLSRGLESLVGVSEVRSFLKAFGSLVPQPSSISELESLSFGDEPSEPAGSGCRTLGVRDLQIFWSALRAVFWCSGVGRYAKHCRRSCSGVLWCWTGVATLDDGSAVVLFALVC